jgi:16S rRNA C967 or C1407 C5-methylase (RsmB/RsmF family)
VRIAGWQDTAVAAAMGNIGLLVACDMRSRRIELLRKTVAATGARNVRIVQPICSPLPSRSSSTP